MPQCYSPLDSHVHRFKLFDPGPPAQQAGGDYFAGSIDPNSIQIDPNSDFVFANGLDNNAQFACNGTECGQDAFDAFNNAIGSLSIGGVNGGDSSWSIWDTIRSMLPPLAGSIFIPIPHTGGTVSVMIPISYIPSTDTSCVGLGLAATTPTGKFVSGGPLVNGNLNNAKNILSGFGYNFGSQATPAIGYQVSTNSSGSVGGPTLATSTGLSAGYGYTVCR